MEVKKEVDTKRFDRCIEKVKERSGKKVNLYAVCNANIGKKQKEKRRMNKLMNIC